LQRKNQALLSFLRLKAIVNGKTIYPLPDSKPVVITVNENKPKIVITDGYHITKPVTLNFKDVDITGFKVECALNDWQLGVSLIILIIFYLIGYLSGLLLFKIFSFLPIIHLLLFYYLNRKDFFKLVPFSTP
jgi:hypothetical protein